MTSDAVGAAKETLGICLVSRSSVLVDDVSFVVEQLNHGLAIKENEPPSVSECCAGAGHLDLERTHGGRVLEALMAQAEGYLRESMSASRVSLEFVLLHFQSLDSALERLPQDAQRLQVEMIIVDACNDDAPDSDPFDPLLELCQCGRDTLPRCSPHSALLYCSRQALPMWMERIGSNRHLRVPLEDRSASRADILRIAVDHLEHSRFNRMLARSVCHTLPPVSMASEVVRFMSDRWQQNWDLHAYTGSMVAGFIQSVQQQVAGTSVRCCHGCNEHSLAVSALAGWQLYGRTYVIAVTSGMIDEFRGTLTNLKRARAPGLIICGDVPEETWFAFQGTMDIDHDGRRVIEARGLRYVFIRQTSELAAKLEEAFTMLAERPEPVFILSSQPVLESRASRALEVPLPSKVEPICRHINEEQKVRLNESLQLINRAPMHMLWQCGELSEEQRNRVYQIADRAGIALTDAITRPGSVGAYHQGTTVENYLGPLSLYGFSRRVYHFLHDDHDVMGPQRQCLFFLKSKVDQAATPFSEGKLKRQIKVVQVNHEPRHISPFTDLALDIPVDQFLDYIHTHLAVESDVLTSRRERLDRVRALPEAVTVDHIATLPMSANHFFLRLGQLVGELVEAKGYRYTGVYDVGRCGISALRNVPRTNPGFSGWYGRALMGDGLMALPYIATTTDGNVLAFIGDGARNLVPDIEAHLIAGLARDPRSAQRNVTLFYLTNGMLSMIQTYLDKRYACNGERQVMVPMPSRSPVSEQVGSIKLSRQQVVEFDRDALYKALATPGQLNIIDVALAHNSDGDGLSLVSETTWSRR
ncbi:hypothetical protein [Halomonas huangheensis]|uniref:Decarboxylase n=1 Tax=Halomonas huangheensis TaxID=1178482 RepID=W1N2Y3_9GAMM|nr:hypothetical protein [Halomonas huangheensis]ALM52371.1 decarboxylase [Halomonas huangheensis]ERL49310.1 hypothetical protein BJB45_07505 [Halomonas huangheensis]